MSSVSTSMPVSTPPTTSSIAPQLGSGPHTFCISLSETLPPQTLTELSTVFTSRSTSLGTIISISLSSTSQRYLNLIEYKEAVVKNSLLVMHAGMQT
ncbi:unnamed protein product [Porites lobata]|uniref:Uncharacterized protein n=1 Tax=Porites lobata TaxID=104759 RepID=A0ABN8P493_9CNID|nr:unnamed protein product [Porites lobata]